MKNKTVALMSLIGVSGLLLGGCNIESMGSFASDFSPFGKPIEKSKEMKSATKTPDESIELKGNR